MAGSDQTARGGCLQQDSFSVQYLPVGFPADQLVPTARNAEEWWIAAVWCGMMLVGAFGKGMNMSEASTIVQNFLAECSEGKAQMHGAFRRLFTNATVWENVGLVTTRGIDEAIALLDQFEENVGATHFTVDTLHIAANGDRVLTERVDHMVADDGRRIKTFRLMGIFEISDGKIAAWRDYFDTASMQS